MSFGGGGRGRQDGAGGGAGDPMPWLATVRRGDHSVMAGDDPDLAHIILNRPDDLNAGIRRTRVKILYRVACALFVIVAAVLVALEFAGVGPRFDIGLHFDAGRQTYNVNASRVNWLVIAASIAFALACAGRNRTPFQEGIKNHWTIFWTPLGTALILADLAVLCRMNDGFSLALLCTLGYCMSVMQQIVFVERLKSNQRKAHARIWWLHICAAIAWGLILVVLWYSASWAHEHRDTIPAPLYVIPLMTVATVLLCIHEFMQMELFYDPWHLMQWAVWREGILLACQFALLCVCGLLPL